MTIFTPEERERLRESLILEAQLDPGIIGLAITGSAAVGRLDRWSDIDLAFCLAPEAEKNQIVTKWTERMYQNYGAVQHLDVYRGQTLFRVFLLANTLQVDLAFWSSGEFGAIGPTFKLVFGQANEIAQTPPPAMTDQIGWAWLYALHVHSSLARNRVWQAAYMLNGMREQIIALVCKQHGLVAHEARGTDDLPLEVKTALAKTLPQSLEAAELKRVFDELMTLLIHEIEQRDLDSAKPFIKTLNGLLQDG